MADIRLESILQENEEYEHQVSIDGDTENSVFEEDGNIDCELLVDLVRSFPILWNTKLKGYKETNKKKSAWNVVASQLGVEDEEMPTTSSDLRDVPQKCYVMTVLLKEILKPFLKAVSWLLEKWILGHLLAKEWKIEKKWEKCDDDVHENNPLHDREVWLDGYFQYIKPTQSISSDGKICSIDRSCPILYPSSCQLCNEPIIKTTNSSLVIMITCEGENVLMQFLQSQITIFDIWMYI
ncbi:uncharacterized protein LOC124434070 [Xenia sp. Carnegie-2017]|uniref:uncharacterized protein LOC124434070 n=1 Tax=Xenia sp. Carnegie-2017 TaxID=2897299 RepID=UPI001F04E0DA|nr:uncharacterized protein LOC124434070 [Xenia sp. Carnegie-2017]